MKKKWVFFVIFLALVVLAAYVANWSFSLRSQDDSLANVQQKGILVVGSDIPFGMMEFFDDAGQPAGIDIDIVKEIAFELGVELRFFDFDWDVLLEKVKSGEIDLAVSSVTITKDRQQEYLFSRPYFNGGQTIVVSSGNNDIKGLGDLLGRRIVVQENTTSYQEALKYTGPENLHTFIGYDDSDLAAVIGGLKADEFDVLLTDYVQALELVKINPDLKIVGSPFTKEDYGIITKLENDSLMDEINKIIEEMERDGRLAAIYQKWISF